MKKIFLVSWISLTVMLLGSMTAGFAAEEKFPNRPISLINPIPPGGPTDIVLRLLSEKTAKALGQPVVVVNKTGGGFVIGMTELAQAKPDGYTVGYLPASAFFVTPQTEKTPYDSVKDYQPILQHGELNFGAYVAADSPYKSWKDIAQAGKTKKLRFGHAGPKSIPAIVLNLMAKNEGFSFINIPYKGSPEYQAALIGGHLDLAGGDFSYSFIEAKKIRLFMILAENRSPLYPDIECLKDAGYDYRVPSPFVVAAPRGTPAPVMRILEESFSKAAKDPEYIKGLAELKLLSTYRPSAEITLYMHGAYERMGEMLKEAGLKN